MEASLDEADIVLGVTPSRMPAGLSVGATLFSTVDDLRQRHQGDRNGTLMRMSEC